MHDRGFKRWWVVGALASASWLVAACGALPRTGGNYEVPPGFVREPSLAGYNGTIRDIPDSIDPRTPDKNGTQGRSLRMDAGERALLQRLGETGLGGSGAAGKGVGPSNEKPAAQSLPGETREPSGQKTNPLIKQAP
ncbi:hypothetical protein [Vitiosangium sp. GDMCC 1.1324]|uniref:hypothetical protein n=1 Tax=Vitiosangium sp. (strain GDMCC 1.1324) TaxID=2138576 RepID=UPI000D35E179|nr:hypothetical protein [Vitiosangium sp. GDMCC 1.1324]PTL81401.1 hypothetical protein DAT35_25195 [Vitiosangium sp. GDMCC 1.1324]